MTEEEKVWLLQRAALVIYPTTVEGFGLIPIEAAQGGTPCLFGPIASLRDLFGDRLARLVLWDAEATARAAMDLMADGGELAKALNAATSALRWDETARQLIDAYLSAIKEPRPTSGDNAVRSILREQEARQLRVLASKRAGSDVDQALGNPDGIVPEHVKRAALAVARRPWLRWPIFGLMKLPHKVARSKSRGLRHR